MRYLYVAGPIHNLVELGLLQRRLLPDTCSDAICGAKLFAAIAAAQNNILLTSMRRIVALNTPPLFVTLPSFAVAYGYITALERMADKKERRLLRRLAPIAEKTFATEMPTKLLIIEPTNEEDKLYTKAYQEIKELAKRHNQEYKVIPRPHTINDLIYYI